VIGRQSGHGSDRWEAGSHCRQRAGREFVMTSIGSIMLVSEDGAIRPESVAYSVELARRLGASVSILMLIAVSDAAGGEGERTLREAAETIAAQGIRLGSSEIRRGDKASEFLKHLAVSASPSTIVWGSDREVLTDRRFKRSGHWLAKVAGQIHCPIVAPSLKGA